MTFAFDSTSEGFGTVGSVGLDLFSKFFYAFEAISLLLVALPLMLATDTTMTGLSVILMPAVLVYAIAYFRRIRQTFLEKDEAEGRLTARAQEVLAALDEAR